MDREIIIRMEILSKAIEPKEEECMTFSKAYRQGYYDAVQTIRKVLEIELLDNEPNKREAM